MTWISSLGFAAAVLTSFSYLPQMRKALPRNSTGDLSLKTVLALFAGLVLWVGYGAATGDLFIIGANSVGAALVGNVLACELRDRAG